MILPDTLSPSAQAARFTRILDDAMRERRERGNAGIGTLAEKWQHQIIKRYLSEDPAEHEVKLAGTRFVSDVRVGEDAYEVQTGSFAPMQKKLAYYLEQTPLNVTVVHPIAVKKTVSRIDPQTQEISPPRRSPKVGRAADLLPKLYPLIPYLPYWESGRLKLRILLLEAQDFRLLSTHARGRRSGERFERIPLALIEDRCFDTLSDFRTLMPPALPSPFTVKQFSAASKLRGLDAYSAVRVLAALGLIEQVEHPSTRAMAFRVL